MEKGCDTTLLKCDSVFLTVAATKTKGSKHLETAFQLSLVSHVKPQLIACLQWQAL